MVGVLLDTSGTALFFGPDFGAGRGIRRTRGARTWRLHSYFPGKVAKR